MKGALEVVLSMCTRYYNNGLAVPLEVRQRKAYLSTESQMGVAGLRGKTSV